MWKRRVAGVGGRGKEGVCVPQLLAVGPDKALCVSGMGSRQQTGVHRPVHVVRGIDGAARPVQWYAVASG